ncbi:MAG: hypothetical protein N4A57_10955 [Anaeromicrobium sp.]|uniref:hypothetical protein n=1 Tax=Anaeromicrobium sp. TaxID=1929132 RepID=UPI0025D50F43|nr:hypothetical protein [Anaeromicrobium sp.]MCT4594771.1 hypothetical protein [Anaeromicrobium sp.]
MRKKRNLINIFIIILTILLSMITVGCEKKQEIKKVNNYGKITLKKFTDEEEILLNSVCDKHFGFQLHQREVDNRCVKFWVDYYENGKKKETIPIGMIVMENFKKNPNVIMLSINKYNTVEKRVELWNISLTRGKEDKKIFKMINKPNEEMSFYKWQGVSEVDIISRKPITLVSYIENGIENISEVPLLVDLNQNEKKYMGQVLKNKYVYLLRCQFIDQ